MTHTLVGVALAKSGLEQRTALATPVLAIAANLPDADIVSPWFGEPYLDFHRGITHAVVGVLVLSAALAGAAWGCGRLFRRSLPRPVRLWPLFHLSFIGVLSHPLLDYLNDYGIRPWLPFSGRWYYGDLVAIADPWLWILLVAAAFATVKSRGWRLVLGTIGAGMAVLVLLFAGGIFGAAWLAVAALALAAALRLGRGFPIVARAALILVAVYVGGTAVARHWLLLSIRAEAPSLVREEIEAIDLIPGRPGGGGLWTAVITTRDRYFIADTRLRDWRRHPPELEPFEKNLGDPCYREVSRASELATMARFARFPQIVSEPDPRGCTVYLRDLRYARRALSGWGVASTRLTSGGASGD